MKKLFVFVPAILLALFLLNSFVIKEKKTTKKTTKVSKIVILKSTDGGQTWQDISQGLPERLQREGVGNNFFTNDHGLYLRSGNGIYHTKANSTTHFWTTDIFPGKQNNIAPGKNGIYVYNFRGQFLKKINGTDNWSPVYTNFQEQAVQLDKTTTDWMYKNYKEREVRSVFETAAGTVFIGTNSMLLRSTNSGKTWKPVHVGDGAMKLAESNGVLLSTSKKGILRSTDDGQTWDDVLSEWGAGIAVERINGGFAAIINNTITKTNSVHISLDSGKTWNVISEELRPSWISSLIRPRSSSDIYSIKQAGKYLISGRTDGIFRSADMGKTWEKLVLPKENFGFSLSVSGNVIYAMPGKGC